MPTYQYTCNDCGHFLEAVQSFSDDALTVCPACGGTLRKIYNAVGVVFKGSGFYRTDSRGSTSAAESGSSSAPASKPDSTTPSGSTGSSTAGSSSTSTATPGS
ncbi:MAG: hypothetical protein NVSMB48_14140 [Marmoricola sp.]